MGAQQNFLSTYTCCSGKYIAICEGMIIGLIPISCRSSFDFYEQNKEFSLPRIILLSFGYNGKMIYNSPLEKTNFTTKDLIETDWGMMTASLFFRKEWLILPEWLPKVGNGDMQSITFIPEW